MFIPDPGSEFFPSQIPDPGVEKAPDLDPQPYLFLRHVEYQPTAHLLYMLTASSALFVGAPPEESSALNVLVRVDVPHNVSRSVFESRVWESRSVLLFESRVCASTIRRSWTKLEYKYRTVVKRTGWEL